MGIVVDIIDRNRLRNIGLRIFNFSHSFKRAARRDSCVSDLFYDCFDFKKMIYSRPTPEL